MNILKSHKLIFVAVVFFIITVLSNIFTYYFMPLRVLNNIPANITIDSSVKGVKYHLVIYLYVENENPWRIQINEANNIDEVSKGFNVSYLNKDLMVDYFYKNNPLGCCFLVPSKMPIYINNKDIVFLDFKKSKYIFINELYRLCGLLFSITFIYFICYYLAVKFPSQPLKD